MSEAAADGNGEDPQQVVEEELAAETAPEVSNETTNLTSSPPPKKRKGPSKSCLKSSRMCSSREDILSLGLWKGVAAEFLGTMLLVLIGCGSCISLEVDGASSIVQIALCFGLSVGTIVWNIAHISGGQINPAITIALLATRKISLIKAALYVIFQLVGAIVGSALLLGLTPEKYHGALGGTHLNAAIGPWRGVGVEIFITFVLVFTVFASIDARRNDLRGSTPLSIGLSVTMCHLFAVQYTGASMNTARSFGPALVTGLWEYHWVYWLGPISGGLAAGLLYDYLFAVNATFNKLRGCCTRSDYDDQKYQPHNAQVLVVEQDPDAPMECIVIADNEKGPVEILGFTES